MNLGNEGQSTRSGVLIPLAVLWLLIACWLLLQFWPDLPHSMTQWFLFVALGPPLYVFAEGLFTWLLSPAHGKAISSRRFSVARVVVALPIGLGALAIGWWLSWLLSRP